MSEAIAVVGIEEFCELEAGSERHDLAAGLLYEALAPAARAAGCRPFTANRLVQTAGGAAYDPDVVVVCDPAAHRLYEHDPSLVVEVLSPSTEGVDRREKAPAFAASPGLRQFVLVDPGRRRIEVAVPVAGSLRWQAYGPGDVVVTGFGDIDVDRFYDRLDAIATTTG